MTNPKVFEFAKEVGLTPLALMDKIREWQIPVKSHMAELEPEVLAQLKSKLSGPSRFSEEPKKKVATRKPAVKKADPGESAKPIAPMTTRKVAAAAAAAAAPPAEGPVAGAVPAAPAAPKGAVVRRKGAVAANAPAPTADSKEDEAQAPAVETAAEVQHEEATSVALPVAPAAPAIAVAPEAPVTAKAPTVQTAAPTQEPVVEATPVPVEEKPEVSKPVEAKVASPARKKEVVVGSSGVSSTPARRNIVGRMDLSRVQPPPGSRPTPAGQGGGFSGPRPVGSFGSGPRPVGSGPARGGLRAGFVAQAPEMPPASPFGEDRGRRDLKKPTRAGDAAAASQGKEEEVAQFNAVEFRKRELVFQPKKKKVQGRIGQRTQITESKASKRVLKVNGSMKVGDVALEMGLKATQLIKALMQNGVMATVNTTLDFDTLALIVPEFKWEAENVHQTAEDVLVETAFGDLNADPVTRPPVVTIMGHVDHGKTSLLDAIRSAKVASGEAGGITQHIGAYSVTLDDGAVITFLDTPGHEAFTAMRARGANATDIAVIVVAADDGMMPQTQEAISHAKAAKVPIIVAINKMDKPGANPDKIKQQLTEMELVPEEWGGSTIYVPVSALKKTGLNELLEQIKLVAEVAELKANPKRSATGLVVESKIEKGKGPVATLLIKDGTIKIGQSIVAGVMRGRVKSLTDDKGKRVNEAGPGFPVEVLGLEGVPAAGDRFDVVVDEQTAEKVANLRKDLVAKSAQEKSSKKMSLEDIFSKVTQGDVKELAIILKVDVQGSLEAITGMIGKLSTPEVKTKILHTGVGGISESDILLASTAKGIVIGFNVRPDGSAAAKAKQLGVDVRTYTIVYELIDELRKAMGGLLKPTVVETVMGRAEVRNTFTVPKIGLIAGCFIVDGKVQRSNQVRLVRDGKIIYDGRIGSLKRFKDDAREVATGFECGIGIENFNDVKVGDVIEAYSREEIARELTQSPTP